ncbi:MAG: RimK family alpha-L-glutamate ligase [Planctomycetota bacterium]
MTSGKFRLGILGAQDSPYVRELLSAARQSDFETAVLGFGELAAQATCDGRAQLKTTLHDFDAVIVRTMPLGSLEQVVLRMDLLQAAVDGGIGVFNRPKCLETCIDKWLTVQRLCSADIAVPETHVCQTRDAALRAFEKLGGDIVVKPIFGGEGRGIMRIQDADLAWRVFSSLEQLRSVLYVQQYSEPIGYDIRVFLIGEQALAMRRYVAAESWKTNVAVGGRVATHELQAEEFQLAKRARDAVAGADASQSIVGVDLLPCSDGVLRVLEVNAVPGWMGLRKATGVDIPQILLNHIRSSVT